MGNCMETYPIRQRQQDEDNGEETGKSNRFAKINENEEKFGPRMKIVLTKEELKWLILQLNENGGMRLEQVLREIERGRQKVKGWKPSLDSILEAPEMLPMDA